MKKTKPPKVIKDPSRVEKVQRFLLDSAADYVASRTLLLNLLPQQGAILSSTAIEKALKAILAFHGNECTGHLQKAHWNAAKNLAPTTYAQLNQDFLKLNQHVYALRYTDSLPKGYNAVIASREFLWELDKTILAIHRSFQLNQSDGVRRLRVIESLAESNDGRILTDNHFLGAAHGTPFDYSIPQFIYEVRNHGQVGFMEVTYWSKSTPDDLSFLRAGLKPEPDNRTFNQAFTRDESDSRGGGAMGQ